MRKSWPLMRATNEKAARVPMVVDIFTVDVMVNMNMGWKLAVLQPSI